MLFSLELKSEAILFSSFGLCSKLNTTGSLVKGENVKAIPQIVVENTNTPS